MNRYIIVCRTAGVYDGIYYSRSFAEQSIDSVRNTWPGLEWEIESSDCGFPVPGLKHLGEVQAPKILKQQQRSAPDA